MSTLFFKPIRLRYILPFAQMAVAVLLLWRGSLWLTRMEALQHIYGRPPAWQILSAMNMFLPVVPSPIYVALVGLLWYWVALNVESLQKQGTVRMFAYTHLRITVDLLLVVLGILIARVVFLVDLPLRALRDGFGWFWVCLRDQITHRYNWLFISVAVLHSIWSFALISSFGRDALYALRIIHRGRPAVAQVPPTS